MQQRFAKYDASITELQGRVKIDTAAHFAFGNATLRDQDKPPLDHSAKVISQHHADALITVDGFTDPAGSQVCKPRLGMERAQAVRDHLINTSGLASDKLRAVSYGEAGNRRVDKGKTRSDGSENRRVTLVVDFTGTPKPAS